MADTDQPAQATAADFEQRTRELLRAQQEAYLAAVKAWRDGLAKGMPGAWPQQQSPIGLSPTPSELAEASFAFASKLLADQSRFMDELGKTMTSIDKPKT